MVGEDKRVVALLDRGFPAGVDRAAAAAARSCWRRA
jgi:hypothetical protein